MFRRRPSSPHPPPSLRTAPHRTEVSDADPNPAAPPLRLPRPPPTRQWPRPEMKICDAIPGCVGGPHISASPPSATAACPLPRREGAPVGAPQADGLAAWRRGWSRGDVMFLARCARSRKVALRHMTDRGRDRRLGRPRAVPDRRLGQWRSVMSCVGAMLGMFFSFRAIRQGEAR